MESRGGDLVCTSLVTDVNQWLVSRMSRLPGFPWGDAGKESNYEMASPLSETRSLPVKRTCGRCMCNTRATTRVAVMRVYKS